jgi:hypothetical protein
MLAAIDPSNMQKLINLFKTFEDWELGVSYIKARSAE